MIGLKQNCVAHPECKAWVDCNGVELCYECWTNSPVRIRDKVEHICKQWIRGLLTTEDRDNEIAIAFGERLLGG